MSILNKLWPIERKCGICNEGTTSKFPFDSFEIFSCIFCAVIDGVNEDKTQRMEFVVWKYFVRNECEYRFSRWFLLFLVCFFLFFFLMAMIQFIYWMNLLNWNQLPCEFQKSFEKQNPDLKKNWYLRRLIHKFNSSEFIGTSRYAWR